MKRILVFKDRLGFIDHPLARGMNLSILLPDGTMLEPEKRLEVTGISDKEWGEWQKEKNKDKVLGRIEKIIDLQKEQIKKEKLPE